MDDVREDAQNQNDISRVLGDEPPAKLLVEPHPISPGRRDGG